MSKYQEIENRIRAQIEDGTYSAGSCLPGEHELMEHYGASRDTIRKALSLLAQDGYIQKAKGIGSIVLSINRFAFPVNGVVSFKELAPTMGNHVETEVICCEKTHPDEKFQKYLKMNPDDWIYLLQRVRRVDGEAIILDTDVLNAAICPGITKEIASDSLYA